MQIYTPYFFNTYREWKLLKTQRMRLFGKKEEENTSQKVNPNPQKLHRLILFVL
jgi:hypothetical protein